MRYRCPTAHWRWLAALALAYRAAYGIAALTGATTYKYIGTKARLDIITSTLCQRSYAPYGNLPISLMTSERVEEAAAQNSVNV
jgi:hypothetical protein